jgi:hypothetical protein
LVLAIHEEYLSDIADGMEKLKKEVENFNSKVKVINTARYPLRPERSKRKTTFF